MTNHLPAVIAYRSPIEAWFWESGAWVWALPCLLLLWLMATLGMWVRHRRAVERMRKGHDERVARMRGRP